MADSPNIVFMLADNIGWGDLSCFGGPVDTPRLDQLASQGIKFDNFNAEAQCTPTRSALITGRMPVRSGTTSVPAPGTGLHYGLAPWEYTMANLLSDAGYATGCFGKWHLGNVAGRIPTDQGFDEWWGISESSDEASYTSHPLFPTDMMAPPAIKKSVKGEEYEEVGPFDLETRAFMDENITNHTRDFIRRSANADTPFYAYVGFTHVHPPMIPHPDFADATSTDKPAPKCIAELDHRTGQILDLIDELDIAENTIVVWAGDNAPGTLAGEPMGHSGKWRGFFGGGWEGCIRSPAMMRWTGHVPAGVVTNEIIATHDWYPTLAALVGESDRVPTDRPIDGIDMSSFVLGETQSSGRDSFLYFGTDAEPVACKWKTLKIHFRYVESNAWTASYVKPQLPLVCDLVADPGETVDLLGDRLEMGWAVGVGFVELAKLQASMDAYPNIGVGEEFQGYE
ncbi:MAG: sulfatase-like hydrolase/transferase [Microthrixaceae bacterium]